MCRLYIDMLQLNGINYCFIKMSVTPLGLEGCEEMMESILKTMKRIPVGYHVQVRDSRYKRKRKENGQNTN